MDSRERGFKGPEDERRAEGRVASACVSLARVPQASPLARPRARSAAAPGPRAPSRGSWPRLSGCRLFVAGRAARERPPGRLSPPPPGARKAHSQRMVYPRRAEPRRPERCGRGGAAEAPRAGGGRLLRGQPEVRAAWEAAGLFFLILLLHHTPKPQWRV